MIGNADNPRRGRVRRARIRRVCRAAVGALVVLLIVRTCFVEGLLVPVRVHGSSMAAALRGSHWQLACEDCGITFCFGAESPPDAGLAACPNCGFQKNDVEKAKPRSGDRVFLDKATLLWSRPKRWDVVAVRMPEHERHWAVKRVVGLPGERVSIRGGDVFVDGEIVRKTPAQFRETAVLVHDDAYRPRTPQATERWRPRFESSPWRRDDAGRWVFESVDTASDEAANPALDWLGYQHLACLPMPAVRDRPSAVLDSLGYNQGLSRPLHESGDLMLQVTLTAARNTDGPGNGVVAMRFGEPGSEHHRAAPPEFDGERQEKGNSGAVLVEIGLDDRTARLVRDGNLLEQRGLETELLGRRVVLELARIDRQWLFAVDGRTVFTRPAADTDENTAGLPALGAARCGLQIDRLRVLRDVHYLHPFGRETEWSAEERLAADEYFLLGDNIPTSRDSRFWGESGHLSRKQIIGRVVRWGR